MTKVYKNGSNKKYCSVIYKKTNKLSIQQKKMVLLKTLLIIYPKNDKQDIVIKVCKCSTK